MGHSEQIERSGRSRMHGILTGTLFVLFGGACGGGGCDACGGANNIPGGFPLEERAANALQIRVTDSALQSLEADPAGLVSTLLGTPTLSIDVPPSCGADPEICCTNGQPDATCGPLDIDLNEQMGDAPRLEINPDPGASAIDVTIRARLRTAMAIPVTQSGIDCEVLVDTSAGARDETQLDLRLAFPQDPDEATTRLVIESTNIDLENEDVVVQGGFLCEAADSFLKSTIINLLSDQIGGILESTLTDPMCVQCPGGSVDECGVSADACTDGVCQIGDRCEMKLGVNSRMSVASLFGSVSSGQLGSMDIFEVAGGYADSDNDGLSMGAYSGMLPFAEARDRCGPAATAPVPTTVAESPFFQGNTRPDTGASFGVGIGIHQQVLDQLSYASYESGALCLNVGSNTVDLLNTDSLGPLLMPSISDLLHLQARPVVLGLRPQSPPAIEIGPGTTTEGAGGETEILDPLLDVTLENLEIDFFVMIDDQFIRVMTVGADLNLPINLEVDDNGEILPVIGDTSEAFQNITVSNAEALRESVEELEAKIPALLTLALPALGDGLGSFALPSLGGIGISIAPDGITSIENDSFVAIFADLSVEAAGQMARVDTQASMSWVQDTAAPTLALSLAGSSPRGAELEWSYRIDGSLWSPYTAKPELTLTRPSLEIPGLHRVEVRARERGLPKTTDRSPETLLISVTPPTRPTYFHGKTGEAACSCQASGSGTGAAFWSLVVLGLLGMRRRRSSGALLALVFALGGTQACSCGSSPKGDDEGCLDECLEGEVERGLTGRFSDLAAGSGRIVASAYDEGLGDLVLVERQEDGSLNYRAVAGVPDEPPTYQPDTYRGGIAGPGEDVGLWSSIAIHEGLVRVAFVNADTGAVQLVSEDSEGGFSLETVAEDTGVLGASHLSLSLDSAGSAHIAFMAGGLPSPDNGGFESQLIYASENQDWSGQTVDRAPISCAGLCEGNELCADLGTHSECIAESSDCGTSCGDAEMCVTGSCVPLLEGSTVVELAEGTGLFAQLFHLSDDSMVLAYYDRAAGDLEIASSEGTGFVPLGAHDDPALDTGLWVAGAVDGNDTLHLAFQDASGDRLLYAPVSAGSLGAVDIVDDGTREGEDRAHPVGASAAVFINSEGVPGILYQDGLTSDLVLAISEQDSWSIQNHLQGPRLDGFFVESASAEGRSWFSHYFYDRAVFPPGELEIVEIE